MNAFAGFSADFLPFFKQLHESQDRDWLGGERRLLRSATGGSSASLKPQSDQSGPASVAMPSAATASSSAVRIRSSPSSFSLAG